MSHLLTSCTYPLYSFDCNFDISSPKNSSSSKNPFCYLANLSSLFFCSVDYLVNFSSTDYNNNYADLNLLRNIINEILKEFHDHTGDKKGKETLKKCHDYTGDENFLNKLKDKVNSHQFHNFSIYNITNEFISNYNNTDFSFIENYTTPPKLSNIIISQNNRYIIAEQKYCVMTINCFPQSQEMSIFCAFYVNGIKYKHHDKLEINILNPQNNTPRSLLESCSICKEFMNNKLTSAYIQNT